MLTNLFSKECLSQLTEDGAGAGGSGSGADGGGFSVSLPDKWYDKLPDEFKGEESLKSITDFNSLVKSYVHAQKMVGAEKISVPGKHATDDDWKNVYTKLGLPKDLATYQVETPKDSKFDTEFLNSFKEIAHKNGILPKQASGLMGFFDSSIKAMEAKQEAQTKADVDTGISSLKNEWGAAFNDNINIARLAVNKLGNAELKDYLEKSGLGNNPMMIKLFSSVGKFLKEEKQLDIGSASTFGNALTPLEAQKKIDSILSDASGPYYNAEHPNHKSAVKEIQDLFGFAHPA